VKFLEVSSVKYDLAVVGHIVRDHITRGKRARAVSLGGPCIYSSLAARALDASVVAVSKVGKDFTRKEFAWIAKRGISIKNIRIANSPTTCFSIDNRDAERTMRVTRRCDPLSFSDLEGLPETLAVHIGPVLDEVPERLAISLAKRDCVVSLEAQGYTRRLNSKGMVNSRKWNNARLLKNVEVMKTSESELRAIEGNDITLGRLSKLGPGIILLTMGTKGTVVWSKTEGVHKIPAYPTHVRDPTGAGDALVGAFLISWIRTGDLLWSCAVGSAVASFVVEGFGPSNFGSLKQIDRRAQKILNETTRMRTLEIMKSEKLGKITDG
jgi:sugar/nucleoside kinase (ribokinase family)